MINTSLIIQTVAIVTTFAATWLTGNKSTLGPALSIAAAACFAVVNAYADLWLCAAFSATMAVVNTRNYIRWCREEIA
jgi:hypothetical protein